MDAQQQLAWDSEVACAVLMGEGKDAYLINLDEVPAAEQRMLLARLGCRFLGVLGIKNGVVDCAPADFHPDTVRGITEAVAPFVEYAKTKIMPKGDSVDFLKRLHALPDTREN
jgi:hypothetical protein